MVGDHFRQMKAQIRTVRDVGVGFRSLPSLEIVGLQSPYHTFQFLAYFPFPAKFNNGRIWDRHLAPVPAKPIIANPGLNIANRGKNFIPRLDSVPESTIKTNPGMSNELNLTHLARTINSLIGGKSLSKQTNGGLTVRSHIRKRKFQQREIDLDQLRDGDLRSRYRFDRKSISP